METYNTCQAFVIQIERVTDVHTSEQNKVKDEHFTTRDPNHRLLYFVFAPEGKNCQNQVNN